MDCANMKPCSVVCLGIITAVGIFIFLKITYPTISEFMYHEENVSRFTLMKEMALPNQTNQTTDLAKLEHSNGTRPSLKECEGCLELEKVPYTIIQFGQPRTATTLQFQILCLMMAMLHEDEASSVGCFYNTKPSKKYNVIKTHLIDFLLTSLPKDVWVFMTTRDRQSDLFKSSVERLEKSGRKVRFIVDTDTTLTRGYSIASEFQSIFRISDTQMSNVMTYLRYWEILRRCCGLQMSKEWRYHLLRIKHYKEKNYYSGIKYPACEMYNITEVEKLFINTYVYKRFTPVESLFDTIGKPSTVDGTLDGSYCKRCNENVVKNHLDKMNLKCT